MSAYDVMRPTETDLFTLYKNDAGGYQPLSRGKITNLIREFQENGNVQTRNTVIEAYIPFVVYVAKKYCGRGVLFLDLIQEGNVALFHAIDKYDPGSGYAFGTYAMWWLKDSMERAIQKQKRMLFLSDVVGEYGGVLPDDVRLELADSAMDTESRALAQLEYEKLSEQLRVFLDIIKGIDVDEQWKKDFLDRYGLQDGLFVRKTLKLIADPQNITGMAVGKRIKKVWEEICRKGEEYDDSWLKNLLGRMSILCEVA